MFDACDALWHQLGLPVGTSTSASAGVCSPQIVMVSGYGSKFDFINSFSWLHCRELISTSDVDIWPSEDQMPKAVLKKKKEMIQRGIKRRLKYCVTVLGFEGRKNANHFLWSMVNALRQIVLHYFVDIINQTDTKQKYAALYLRREPLMQELRQMEGIAFDLQILQS